MDPVIIKQFTQEFFDKLSVSVSDITVSIQPVKEGAKHDVQTIQIAMESGDPQLLIGQAGQTLSELQRVLRMIFCKKLQANCYVDIDINGYREKKVLYLKNLAKNIADEVFLTRSKKILPPMSSYERRIIHAELAGRQDIITESQGEGLERRVVVSPVQ